MRKDLTDITVVLDRSTSMSSCQSKAEEGLNSFINEQKSAAGDANFTLIEFDTEYEIVHNNLPINTVPRCTLSPRGCTALLDAVGRGIGETTSRLSGMNEKDKPALVVFVILTDGEENSSTEFTKDRIKELIGVKSGAGWQFTFLGANQDAFAEAGSMGMSKGVTMNYSPDKTDSVLYAASANVKRMRSASLVGAKVENLYTTDEVRSCT